MNTAFVKAIKTPAVRKIAARTAASRSSPSTPAEFGAAIKTGSTAIARSQPTPASSRNRDSTWPRYQLTRDIPVDESYDILVAGGGPAGTAAAVCAARLGAKVLLVEANGCLGGMGTSGLVSTFGPVSDGKRMLVGGFMKELVESMYQRGDARTPCGAGISL